MRSYIAIAIGLVIAAAPSPARALSTTEIAIAGNLDASVPALSGGVAGIPAVPGSTFAQLNAAAAFSTSVDVFDTLCASHALTIYFFKTGMGSWTARGYVDGSNMSGGTAGEPALLGTVNMTFNANGLRTDANYFIIDPTFIAQLGWANGAADSYVTVSLSPLTQFSGSSSISSTSQDGSGVCTGPTHSDLDADGTDDYGVFRPSSGMWAILQSGSGNATSLVKQWGRRGDYPMFGDYTGDGRPDLVLWRPSIGTWYICKSDSDYDCTQGIALRMGSRGDRPVKGDFDGDGVFDIAVWRPRTLYFYYIGSKPGAAFGYRRWGNRGDIPLGAGVSQ